MKTATELYPELAGTEGTFYGPADYGPILESFGEILLRSDDHDYQGDSRVLYRDGDRFGVLIFGWGSCSGCDGLQACGSLADVDDLIAGLSADVRWGSREETLNYLVNHDWQGNWYGHEEETKAFVATAIGLLGGHAPETDAS